MRHFDSRELTLAIAVDSASPVRSLPVLPSTDEISLFTGYPCDCLALVTSASSARFYISTTAEPFRIAGRATLMERLVQLGINCMPHAWMKAYCLKWKVAKGRF